MTKHSSDSSKSEGIEGVLHKATNTLYETVVGVEEGLVGGTSILLTGSEPRILSTQPSSINDKIKEKASETAEEIIPKVEFKAKSMLELAKEQKEKANYPNKDPLEKKR